MTEKTESPEKTQSRETQHRKRETNGAYEPGGDDAPDRACAVEAEDSEMAVEPETAVEPDKEEAAAALDESVPRNRGFSPEQLQRRGRSVELPRMSKHLRSLMREVAASLTSDGSQPLVDEGLHIEIDHDTIQWYGGTGEETDCPNRSRTRSDRTRSDRTKSSRPKGFGDTGPEPTGTTRLAQSKMQAALRSLYSNEAGAVWIRGLDSVSWSMDGKAVAERLLEKDLIRPGGDGQQTKGSQAVEGGEGTCESAFRIARKAVQNEWARGVRRVIRGSREAEIRLSDTGKEMLRDIWAWEEAKAVGVPLEAAQSNERLPEEYLSPSQKCDPGRYRTRGLYQEEVGGTSYFSNGSLIVRGTPPVLEEKHQATDRIGRTLAAIDVERGTLFAEKTLPTTYVEERSSSTYSPGPSRYIILENGMCVGVRSCLFVQQRFPDGIWTTARYDDVQEPPEWKPGAEAKRIQERYPVVVGPENEILALMTTFDPRG